MLSLDHALSRRRKNGSFQEWIPIIVLRQDRNSKVVTPFFHVKTGGTTVVLLPHLTVSDKNTPGPSLLPTTLIPSPLPAFLSNSTVKSSKALAPPEEEEAQQGMELPNVGMEDGPCWFYKKRKWSRSFVNPKAYFFRRYPSPLLPPFHAP